MNVPETAKEERCFSKLLELVENGWEFPDAVCKASNNGKDIDSERLKDLYDFHCVA